MKDCTNCNKIICKSCGWKASDIEVLAIQEKRITNCPVCGWSPGEIAKNEANSI